MFGQCCFVLFVVSLLVYQSSNKEERELVSLLLLPCGCLCSESLRHCFQSGKSSTIRESNQTSGLPKAHYVL